MPAPADRDHRTAHAWRAARPPDRLRAPGRDRAGRPGPQRLLPAGGVGGARPARPARHAHDRRGLQLDRSRGMSGAFRPDARILRGCRHARRPSRSRDPRHDRHDTRHRHLAGARVVRAGRPGHVARLSALRRHEPALQQRIQRRRHFPLRRHAGLRLPRPGRSGDRAVRRPVRCLGHLADDLLARRRRRRGGPARAVRRGGAPPRPDAAVGRPAGGGARRAARGRRRRGRGRCRQRQRGRRRALRPRLPHALRPVPLLPRDAPRRVLGHQVAGGRRGAAAARPEVRRRRLRREDRGLRDGHGVARRLEGRHVRRRPGHGDRHRRALAAPRAERLVRRREQAAAVPRPCQAQPGREARRRLRVPGLPLAAR
jgi:hypothetical protein